MSTTEWILGTTAAVLYLFFIFTVGLLTFRKGHFVLGILGIFVPSSGSSGPSSPTAAEA